MPNRLPVPVVVVGNIYVGGTGKTPVTIALVRELQARGWRPGVISRGFGRREDGIRLINEETPAAEAGDEPLLIARELESPLPSVEPDLKRAERFSRRIPKWI